MRTFKRSNHFNGSADRRDSGRPSERSFKKFSGGSSGKFGKKSDRPKTFGTKESRSGNGFKLHEAICDKCGQKCDLPFEPTGNKPIYCRSCFRENQNSGERFEQRNKPHDRFEKRESRSSNRFEEDDQSGQDPSKDSLDRINRKLDKIMKALKIN